MSTTQLYPPTTEQQQALDLFRAGTDLVIKAGAGTGKTAALVFLAEDGQTRGLRGQFLAFNKGIIEDCKGRFPASCDVRTVHSLAFRNIMGSRPGLKARLNSSRLARSHEAAILDVHDINIEIRMGDVRQAKRLSAEFLVAHVMRGVERFCQSDSMEIEAWHFPTIEGIDQIDEAGRHRGDNNRRIANEMLTPMRRAWADLIHDLQRYGSTQHPELAPFSSWEAVQAFIADDPAGTDLKLLVDLVDEYGPDFIIRELDHTVSEARADLIVSTAHTSKGREWDRVKLADDFVREGLNLSVEELRLLYVAVTRAKLVLDALSVPMLLGGGAKPAPEGDGEEGTEGGEASPEPVAPDPAPQGGPAPEAQPLPALAELPGIGFLLPWSQVEPGDILDHPTVGRIRIDSARQREGMVRLLAKRVGQTGQVLIDERPDEMIEVLRP